MRRLFARVAVGSLVGATLAVGVAGTSWQLPPAAAAGLANVDFDGDGIGDYAVGAAGESGGAGGVYTFYGATETTPGRQQYWSQDSASVQGTAQPDDAFGAAVAAGDFNNDGFDDLAIGVPGEMVSRKRNAGAVQVLYGSANGLRATGNEYWTQDRGDIQTSSAPNELFGTALAAGDFNDDGRDDLAIGAPGEQVGRFPGAGTVHILHGCSCGLTSTRAQRFSQDTADVAGAAGRDENFGFSLAVGKFGGDAIDDLAIGVPGETVGRHPGAGGVVVMRGRATAGLTGNASQLWTEVQLRIAEANGAEDYDFFGFSIAAGDLNLDGVDDLAIGAPGEYSGTIAFSGAAFVAFGDDALLGRPGAQMVTQDTDGVLGRNSKYQEFGHTVFVAPLGNVDAGPADDYLVVGVPYEDVGGNADAGVLHVFEPSASGVVTTGSKMWSLDSDGILGEPTLGGWFGITFGATDTDGDGVAELLVGSPGEDVGTILGSGGITRFGEDDTEPVAAGSIHWTEASDGISGRAAKTDFFGAAFTF